MDTSPLDYVTNDVTVGGVRPNRQVELLVRCENLVDLDVFSKTDPMCVLYGRQFGQWKELGRTEAVDNTLNPRFTETFILEYDREINYPLKFSVYDIDIKSSDLRKQDFVGSVETTLTTLAHPDTKVTQTLYTLRAPGDPKGRGQILVTAEQLVPSRSKLILHLGATKLNKAGLLKMSKRSTCLEICRSVSENYFHPIHRTEVYHKSQDPRWRPFELSIQKLCNGDPDRRLQFVCWQIKENQEQHFVGATTTTLRDLTKQKKIPEMPLLKYKKGDFSKSPLKKGHLRFLQSRLDMAFTVRDYVRGGCSLRFMVAIDFTSSNGEATCPSSLHFLGKTDNEYVEAIKSIGSMLSHYDLDQNHAAFGFGAKTKPDRPTKHCFPLNGLRNNPFCKGLQGVLDGYREAVGRLKFSGPSKLAPVIKEATRLASLKPLTQRDQEYWVLMVVTDGVVNDIDDMVEALIRSCTAPLSFVIVGIGPADFSTMEELLPPLSHHPLTCTRTGLTAERSNVHFAALRKDKYTTGNHTTVAREALATVSRHMVDYFNSHSITPNPPTMHRIDPVLGGWVDDDVIDGTMTAEVTSSSRGTTSGGSLHLVTSAPGGPMCPTCGSHVQGSRDPLLSLKLDSR